MIVADSNVAPLIQSVQLKSLLAACSCFEAGFHHTVSGVTGLAWCLLRGVCLIRGDQLVIFDVSNLRLGNVPIGGKEECQSSKPLFPQGCILTSYHESKEDSVRYKTFFVTQGLNEIGNCERREQESGMPCRHP